MITRATDTADTQLSRDGTITPRFSSRMRPTSVGLRLGTGLVLGIGLLVTSLGSARANVAPGNHAAGATPQSGTVTCVFTSPPGTAAQTRSTNCPLPSGCAIAVPAGTPPPIGTPQAGTVQITGGMQQGVASFCAMPPGCSFMPMLTVTNVNGNTITGTTFGSSSVTVTVDSATTYTKAEAAASLSDVHPGSRIAASGACSKDGTMQATAVTIVLPQVTGVVTASNGSTLTVTGLDAIVDTINVDDTTRYQRAGQSAALSAISTGALISAEGNKNSDGSLSALLIHIQLPHLAGNVTAVNGATITITTADGTTATVVTSAATTYETGDKKTASLSSISTGSFIVAEGAISADESTLNALRVSLMPDFGSGGIAIAGGAVSLGEVTVQSS